MFKTKLATTKLLVTHINESEAIYLGPDATFYPDNIFVVMGLTMVVLKD